MSPIDKVSDIRRLPRLGTIKLGIKKEGQKGPYPVAVDYFVCPPEVQAVYGDKPTELDVMLPDDNYELVAPQYYKCYSYSQGLICRGDGKTCRRKVDTENGDFANRDTKEWAMADAVCNPEHCPMIGDKQCKKVMSLQLLLPEVPGLGVYQLNTGSFYSIVNINSQLAPDGYLRRFTKGRIGYLPLVLSIGPQVVTPPGVGRKTIHTLGITAKIVLSELIRLSHKEPARVLLPVVEEEEPPDDLYPDELLAEAEGVGEASGGETAQPTSHDESQSAPQAAAQGVSQAEGKQPPPTNQGSGDATLQGGAGDALATAAAPATPETKQAGPQADGTWVDGGVKAAEAAPSVAKRPRSRAAPARPHTPTVAAPPDDSSHEKMKPLEDVVEDDVPDINALFRVCNYFWKNQDGKPMQPADVARELGYGNTMDLYSCKQTPWQLFLTIKVTKATTR